MKTSDLEVLTLSEAARLLAVSTRTVRRLIDRGTLSAMRIGATLVIAQDALPKPLQGGSGRTPLLTLHEVAHRLDIAPRQIRNLTSSGRLDVVPVGHSLRWAAQEVEALRSARMGGRRT